MKLVSAWLATLALVASCLQVSADEAPGALIARTRIDGAPAGATAWRVRYRSRGLDGHLVDVTGIVVVPKEPVPEGGRDIVTWGHATVGVAESCAPSTSPTLFKDIAGLRHMIEKGWIVAATDFQGLGTSGPSPYLVGVSSGHALLDAARAARAVPDARASANVVAWGESQGAHAALWAGQLAKDYAPELTLRGVAAAAPPTNLVAGYDMIANAAVRALLTAYTSEPWSHIYHLSLSTFANPLGQYLIGKVSEQCLREDPVGTLATLSLLFLSRQIPNGLGKPWLQPLGENSVKPMRLDMPILVAQGSKDEVVIPHLTKEFAEKSCKVGNALRFVAIEGGDHTTIAARSEDATLPWIADRFAQKPPPSDCATLVQTLGTR